MYYPNGRLKIKTVFANNKIHGEWTYYGLDGVIITKGVYREGVKYGYWAYKSLRTYGRYKKGFKNKKWNIFMYYIWMNMFICIKSTIRSDHIAYHNINMFVTLKKFYNTCNTIFIIEIGI